MRRGRTWAAARGVVLAACVVTQLTGCIVRQETTTTTDQPLWTQVFTTWTCTASGRPEWKWSAAQLSDYGESHRWTDLDSGKTNDAKVYENTAYLQKDGQTFRNFEYKIKTSQVLDHLEESSLTAEGAAPYVCTK